MKIKTRILAGLCPLCTREIPDRFSSRGPIPKWTTYEGKRVQICIHHPTPDDNITMCDGKIVDRDTGAVIDSTKEECLQDFEEISTKDLTGAE